MSDPQRLHIESSPGETPRSREAPTPRQFRDIVGHFTTGVTVVTAAHDGKARGMTASSFTSVSLDPLLILICLRLGSATDTLAVSSGHFAVSILSAKQRAVAAWFANAARPDDESQLDVVGWRPGAVAGAPLVSNALAWLECAVARRMVVGDHAVLFGRVAELTAGAVGAPLVFHRGSFGTFGALAEPIAS